MRPRPSLIKIISAVVISVPLIIFAQETDDIPETQINLVLGIDRPHKLDFAPSTKIQVGNESIVTYTLIPQRREITFKGIRAGQTSIIVRNTVGEIKTRFRVTVTANSQAQVVKDLRDFLDDVEGIKIGIKGGKVYVGGEIVVPRDIGLVFTVLQSYNDVIKLYELSPQTQIVIARKVKEEYQRANLSDVTVRVVNGVFWLEGVVSSEAERDLALKIAEGYLPDKVDSLSSQASRVREARNRPVIQNFITIKPPKDRPKPPERLIKVITQFVELTKDYTKVFGFKWTPTLATGGGTIQFGKTTNNGVTTDSNGTFSGTISNLFPKLAAAKSAGYARVIQSGMVILKDKGSATLSKSKTSPFTLGTGEFTKAASVSTGFNLSVNASIVGSEKIEMGLGVSVKIGAGDNGSTDNNIKTKIVVTSKETAVVGGISVNESSSNFDKDPPFGTDQVDANTGSPLFSFLRSKAYLISRSQFVVFVTPEIIQSAAETTERVKRKFRQRRR